MLTVNATRTGQDYTRDWMDSNCKFIVTDDSLSSALRELTSVTSKALDQGGQVYLHRNFHFFCQVSKNFLLGLFDCLSQM